MDPLDHRYLGQSLDLFHFCEDAVGSPIWHPRGYALYRAVEDYMRARVVEDGYQEIRSPILMSRELWQRSGHLELYGELMFAVHGDLNRPMLVKPMNCPGHVEVFNAGLRSWRDLPLRLCEFGQCHRNEPSGALHGLLRLRAFVQDDGHVFCRPDQVDSEVARFCRLLARVYADFGFGQPRVCLSLRPSLRAGLDSQWDMSEALLAAAAHSAGLEPVLVPGEGAFYGPKLEFSLVDRAGRAWQCGTLQLDTVLPARLGALYRDEHDIKVAPVMLHRAVLGSLERFVGILLEHHEGKLPAWLAPEQVGVLAVADRHHARALELVQILARGGLRVRPPSHGRRLGAGLREAALMGVPYAVVVGDQELAGGGVSLRMPDGSSSYLELDAALLALRQGCALPG